MRRFAKTIVKVLIAYADIVKREFPEQMKEERVVSGSKIIGNKKLLPCYNFDFTLIGLHFNE